MISCVLARFCLFHVFAWKFPFISIRYLALVHIECRILVGWTLVNISSLLLNTNYHYYYETRAETRIRTKDEWFLSRFFCEYVRFPAFYWLWCAEIFSFGKEPFVMSQSAPVTFQNMRTSTSLFCVSVCVRQTHTSAEENQGLDRVPLLWAACRSACEEPLRPRGLRSTGVKIGYI